MAFTDASKIELPERAILSVEGIRGVGKSEFGLWGKADVAYLRFDLASEGALRKMRKLRPNKIKVSTFDFEREPTKKVDGRVKEFDKEVVEMAEETYRSFVTDYRFALKEGFKTVVIDDGTTPWELLRIARFRKVEQVPQQKYDMLNWEYKKLLKEALESNSTLVMLHPLREEWTKKASEDGKTISFKTGKYEMEGFKRMDFVAHAIIRLYRAGDPTDPDKTPPTDQRYNQFCAQFLKANEHGDLVGQTVNFNEYAEAGYPSTYAVVMSMIYKNSPEDWL